MKEFHLTETHFGILDCRVEIIMTTEHGRKKINKWKNKVMNDVKENDEVGIISVLFFSGYRNFYII